MDIGDLFGPNPQRPDTPEFWRMSEIILKLDGRMDAARTDEEKEVVWNDNVEKWAGDQDALVFVAFQRAMRVLELSTVGDVKANMDILLRLMVLYSEAFQVGAEYHAQTIAKE